MTVTDEVTDEMLTAAMRAFELMSSVLRYREKDKWHSCDIMGMRDAIKAALAARPAALTAALSDQVVVARPLSEWHEDMGPMLWWCWEPPKAFERISERVVSSAHDGKWLGEAPYVGGPNDSDWPDYHTHFTPISLPAPPPASTAGEVK